MMVARLGFLFLFLIGLYTHEWEAIALLEAKNCDLVGCGFIRKVLRVCY